MSNAIGIENLDKSPYSMPTNQCCCEQCIANSLGKLSYKMIRQYPFAQSAWPFPVIFPLLTMFLHAKAQGGVPKKQLSSVYGSYSSQ